MADSPAHKFGQIIGDLLEEIMAPQLQLFCNARGLYLDKKGTRGTARPGKKVTWEDKFGNNHDLDFVIEKGGNPQQKGRPLAFIEAAWRRYTKHSRNKAQEIQGAILPIAEKYYWDQPFLGTILAGEFTAGSLTQMQSSGFKVMYFPYETVVAAFASVGINAEFDESTPDSHFQRAINQIEALNANQRSSLKNNLIQQNSDLLNSFLTDLKNTLDRQIDRIVLIPLHGGENQFQSIRDALDFVQNYNTDMISDGTFRKFEIIVWYNNGNRIDAQFSTKDEVFSFLNYVATA
ncbi:MAG: hypothetical protein NC112_05905 [Oxalobacter formigenes]|nr:hypothetical protein [Oxalobacter formigenes]